MNNAAERERLRVVLVESRNPLNIGAAARAMSNFGFSRLRTVNLYEVAFQEARSAVGAAEVLRAAEQFKNVADAVADCELVVGTTGARSRDIEQPLYRLEQGGRRIRAQLGRGPVALLFGSEKFGLSNEDLTHCHFLLRIPTREEHASMNLGQSVAVCLYELIREGKAPAAVKRRRAPAGAEERITSVLTEALRASGYIKARTAASTETKIRRLVRRLNLEPTDAELVLGMLRQMLWKIGKSE